MISAAVSGGCCNEELVEPFGWIVPVEGLPGSPVEFAGDGVEVVLGVAAKVGAALGEVLAEQAVGVLVAAALPGRVGIAEVDLAVGGEGECCVLGHLGTLVPGQGFEMGRAHV